MPAAKSSSDSSSGAMYFVIGLFVVLFLAAAVFAVVMYLNNEDLRIEAENARQELNSFATSAQRNEVRPMQQGQGTVLGQLKADMQQMAAWIGGEQIGQLTLPEAKVTIEKILDPLYGEIAAAIPNLEELDKSMGLVNAVSILVEEKNTWQEMYEFKEQESQTDIQNLQEQITQRDEEIDQLKSNLQEASQTAAKLEQQYQTNMQQSLQKYEDLISRFDQEKETLQQQNETLNQNIEDLQETIAQYQSRMSELEQVLKGTRPKPDSEVMALEPDGYVVSVNLRDELAYINLSNSDPIYRGLTFSVYDSFQDIPKSGVGKGKLEVIDIMETISKCRITDYDLTNPIMEKDIIANLIWDKDKKFKFCVTGEFDVDQDGNIDPDGRAKIKRLINMWGGEAVDSLSVDTDFLVLGEPPVVPAKPRDEDLDRNTFEAKVYKAAVQMRQSYEQTRENAAALGVPTFNTTRFYRFVGFRPEMIID